MTRDNNLLGKFELSGIPPAPRGVPQVLSLIIFQDFPVLFDFWLRFREMNSFFILGRSYI